MDYIVIFVAAIFAFLAFFAFAIIALFISCDLAAEAERKRKHENETHH